MLRVGATMTTEAWDTKYKDNNGWSHAWSSSPAHILPRKVIGIVPAEPGFKRVAIKPQPAGLKWAKAKLPTIRGPIEASFDCQQRSFTLALTLPANMKADVYLPIPAEVDNFTLLQNGVVAERIVRDGDHVLLENIGAGSYEFKLDY